MKKRHALYLISLLLLATSGLSVFAPGQPSPASKRAAALPVPAGERGGAECFSVLVGKKASADGSVMIAHNEDDYGDIVVNLRKIAGRDYGAPRAVRLAGGGTFETGARTQPFLWMEASAQEFADSFVNEAGVVITSDSCASRETNGELEGGGIGYMLRRVMAEQATSARDAVSIAGRLIETYGYSASGRTYLIADKDEAWMLAAIRGRHWFAERVPDDEVAVIPNWYTIRGIRPGDAKDFLGSADIVEYAKRNGWYDPAKDGSFDFKKAFARPSSREAALDGNTLRNWRGLERLTGRSWKIDGDYPFSVKPARKVTVSDLMSLLRDHYEGTPYDATEGYKNGTPNATKFRTICTRTTIYAFVAALDARRPAPLAASLWLALGKPDTTIFMPLYYGIANLPAGAGFGPAAHDDEILYKQHFDEASFKAGRGALLQTKVLDLQKKVEAGYGTLIEALRRDFVPAEQAFVEARAAFESRFAKLYRRDKRAAMSALDEYVAGAFVETARRTDGVAAALH